VKVLFTHEIFMPDFHGGGEFLTYEIVKRMIKSGFDVTVLTTGDPKIKNYENIPTIRLPVNRYLMNLAGPMIAKYARNFDLIQSNNYNACFPSLIAGKLVKKPVYCMVHGMYGKKWLSMRGHFFGNVSRAVEKFQVSGDYEKIIFFSEFARNSGVSIGIPKEQTIVIHPGIEYKNFYVGEKEPYVLFVGRLSKQKGITYLIEAAKQLPHIKFKVAGRDEEESRIKQEAPKNVEFLGFVSNEELRELHSRALVFCLPSVAETFGLVILDAMASGCAVVSTVPLDYKGFKVDVGDVEQLKNAILYLFENPAKALNMGIENREKVKEYRWDKCIEKLGNLYSYNLLTSENYNFNTNNI
jgi:glycosyltransferase involved in cell wall biosynthesis